MFLLLLLCALFARSHQLDAYTATFFDQIPQDEQIADYTHFGVDCRPLYQPLRTINTLKTLLRPLHHSRALPAADRFDTGTFVVDADSVASAEPVRKRAVLETPVTLSEARLEQARRANAQYQDRLSYLGCWADAVDAPDFEFAHNFTVDSDVSPQNCAKLCREKGLGKWRYMGLRAATCFCGSQFGAHGPLNGAYCRSTCVGTIDQRCAPEGIDLELARNTTKAEEALLFIRQHRTRSCGGGEQLPELERKDICATPMPTPQPPTPPPTPMPTDENVRYGVDWTLFNRGTYGGVRNSVFRTDILGICGLGAAQQTTPTIDTCEAGKNCRISQMVCNGTLVNRPSAYSHSIQLCAIRKLQCADEEIDLAREYNTRDCAVREFRCNNQRVAPTQYTGDITACDVRVRCNNRVVEYGYDAFGWQCRNDTVSCPEGVSAGNDVDNKCSVIAAGCDQLDPPRRSGADEAGDDNVTTGASATPAPAATPASCVTYSRDTGSGAWTAQTRACAAPCRQQVTQTTCRCPSDRYGARCQYEREFTCELQLMAPEPSCRQSTKIRDDLLSTDRACFHYDRNDTTRFAYRMHCEFKEQLGGLSPAIRNLLLRGAALGIPAARDALNGVRDNATALLEPLLARFNETLEQVTADPRTAIDTSFQYFVMAPGQFALSEPPFWHIESKFFDFEALSDRSQVKGVTLSLEAMRGDALFWFNRSLASIPKRFVTAKRMYEELHWSTNTRPNGTEAARVLRRHFIDLRDDRSETGVVDGGVDSTVMIVLLAVAVVLVLVVVIIVVVVRRKRRRYQRR